MAEATIKNHAAFMSSYTLTHRGKWLVNRSTVGHCLMSWIAGPLDSSLVWAARTSPSSATE
jgi:hypothetical protein